MSERNDWNNDSNLASWRESYPGPDSSFGAEMNNVSGVDPGATKELPGEGIVDSLSEVRKEGKMKEASRPSSIRKVVIAGGMALVTAATIISTVTSGKPSVLDYSSETENNSFSYSFVLSYSKAGNLRVKLRQFYVDKIKEVSSYSWKEGSVNGSLREKKISGSFDLSSLAKGKFSLMVEGNIGYGYMNVYTADYIKE